MISDVLRWCYEKARGVKWNAQRAWRALPRVRGLASKARILQLAVENSVLPERAEPPARTAVRFHAAGYGQDVWLRPRSSDLAAFDFVTTQHHLPPDIEPPLEHIAVFGANVGVMLLDYAARYPAARLLAVEPEPENAALGRRNLSPLGDRCMFVEAAVWYEDAELEFSRTQDAWGFNLARNVTADERARGTQTVKAIDAGALLDDFTGGRPVDYVLVNIETAWYELLRHGDWTRNVRSLKVEVVDHYDEVVPLLEAQGFRAHLERLSWGAYGVGTRP